MFNSQPNNTPKNSQPLVLENNKQTVETPVQLFKSFSELSKPNLENETNQQSAAYTPKEQSILELVRGGWRFRLKTIGGKGYLCARTFKEEYSLGLFDEETKQIIEKHKITVNGFNEKPSNA
jgi:hypothetical protein